MDGWHQTTDEEPVLIITDSTINRLLSFVHGHPDLTKIHSIFTLKKTNNLHILEKKNKN